MKLSRSPEAGVFEAPSTSVTNPELPKEPTAAMQEYLDIVQPADSTMIPKAESLSDASGSHELGSDLSWMSPEARENAEDILSDFGSVAVSTEVEKPYIDAGINEAHAYAHDPKNSTKASGGGGKDGATSAVTSTPGETPKPAPRTITEAGEPRKATADELVSINESLNDFKETTSEVIAPAATKTEEVPERDYERPISIRRYIVEPVVSTESTASKSKIGKFVDRVSKRANKLADLYEGTTDIRADTKHMIAIQKEALGKRVGTARTERNSARTERKNALIHNNRFARNFGGANREKRDEIRQGMLDDSFRKIGEARSRKNEKRNRPAGQESWTDGLRKGAATLKAYAEARAVQRESAKASISETRTKHRESASELGHAKDLRRATALRPWRVRRTIGGASGGLKSSLERAKSFDSTTEAQKLAQAKKRAEELMKKRSSDDARKKWQTRDESKIKSDRGILYGPATPGRKADRVSGRF